MSFKRLCLILQLSLIQTCLTRYSSANTLLTCSRTPSLTCIGTYLSDHASLLSSFCDLPSSELQAFVNALSEYYNDLNRFKLALRDFLIQLKEFSGDDNAELYLEEREAENAKKAELARQQAMRIPGMLKPDQLEDKDEDI